MVFEWARRVIARIRNALFFCGQAQTGTPQHTATLTYSHRQPSLSSLHIPENGAVSGFSSSFPYGGSGSPLRPIFPRQHKGSIPLPADMKQLDRN
ncbi:hypothetical protein BT69DRAFT_1282635 [Atractiella rhizophila]|nr:hypothetical protein BT69DRAFT_1282635 [Atractiella rhizophila]